MNAGIVLRKDDAAIRAAAKKQGLPVAIEAGATIPYDRALVVGPGAVVPWQLVGAGFKFVGTWDAAAPLWRYGVLAQDLGSKAERKRTQEIVRDLRVPVYACELLFVQNSEAGRQLLAAWQAERAQGADERLAFLRALYQVKPRFLALPRSWLRETSPQVQVQARRPARRAPSATVLSRVEILPGRFVRCRSGEEEAVKRRFALQQARRGRR